MSTVVFGVSTAVLSDRFFRFLARPPNGHGRPRFLPGHGKYGSDGGRWRQGFSLHTIASGRTLPTHTTKHGTHVPTTPTLHVSYRLPNTPFMAHASPANLPVTTTATHNLSLTLLTPRSFSRLTASSSCTPTPHRTTTRLTQLPLRDCDVPPSIPLLLLAIPDCTVCTAKTAAPTNEAIHLATHAFARALTHGSSLEESFR